jgi:NitT/TauT family transport system permease protein
MKQRVGIARSIASDPQVLLMDEPFSALDELTRESLCDYLLNIWADSGKTVVFVTHSVNEAIYLSDRIMVLDPASAGILIGYGFAVGIGIVLAVLITYSRTLHSLISPALVVFQSAPKDALAPILLIWFGFGSLSVIVMVALLSVFPIVIQTSVGFELVDPELHELARSLRASTLRRFVKVDFPSGLPSCFAGLKVAMTLAVVGAIVGELVSTTKGLGYIIESATVQGTVALSLASLVVLSLLGLVLYQAVAVIERLAAPWRHDNQ